MSGNPRILDLGFSTRVRCSLGAHGVHLLSDLLDMSHDDLLQIADIGKVSVASIAERLNELGLPPLKNWSPKNRHPQAHNHTHQLRHDRR